AGRLAEGWAWGERAAVRVQLVAEGVDPDAARRGDDLRREGLVDLDDVDVVDAHPGALERLPRGVDRAEAHELRFQRRKSGGNHAGDGFDAELVGSALRHDDDRGGAVVPRARVAYRHGAALAERRLPGCRPLRRRPGTRAVVLGERLAVGQRDRNDLEIEQAVVA